MPSKWGGLGTMGRLFKQCTHTLNEGRALGGGGDETMLGSQFLIAQPTACCSEEASQLRPCSDPTHLLLPSGHIPLAVPQASCSPLHSLPQLLYPVALPLCRVLLPNFLCFPVCTCLQPHQTPLARSLWILKHGLLAKADALLRSRGLADTGVACKAR